MNELIFFMGAMFGIILKSLSDKFFDWRIEKQFGNCEKCGLPNYQSFI